MSAFLTSLSPELLNCVIANVDSQPALCKLAQCSRQFYSFTVPHLYRRITIHEEDRQLKLQSGPLQHLACLLTQRPDLAGLVRHFTVHVACTYDWVSELSEEPEDIKYSEDLEESDESEEFVYPENVKVDQALKNAVKALGLPKQEGKDWLRRLGHNHECHPHMVLALLLSVLLNVEKLVLDLDCWSNARYLGRIIQRAACKERPFDVRRPFEALTHFDDPRDIHSREFIASLLKLPAMQVFSGRLGMMWNEDIGGDSILKKLDSCSSSLTTLNLDVHRLSMIDLGHIIRAPKALKTLYYTDFSPHRMNFTDICNVLRPHENCLENLAFDCDNKHWYYSWWGKDEELLGPMTSLIRFSTLKTFSTVGLFLETTENGTGKDSLIDLFPATLETLCLTCFHASSGNLVEALEYLLAHKSPQQIPSLKSLLLEEGSRGPEEAPTLTDVLWKDINETVVARLSSVAKAHGVSFRAFFK